MKFLINKIESFFEDFFDEGGSLYSPDRIDYVLIVFFFLASFLLRFMVYSKSGYANGTDGYVYLIQMKSILEGGRMHFRDSSLIYPYLSGIAFFLKDYLLSLKIGIALLAGCFTAALCYFGLIRGEKRWAGVLAGLLALMSPSVTFFASQFPKNFLALVFFVFVVTFFQKRSLRGVVIFSLLAFVSHRLVAGLLLIFFFLIILASRKYKIIISAAVSGIVLLLLVSLFLPGTLHVSDLERFSGAFAVSFNVAPLSFVRLLGPGHMHPVWILEIFSLYFFTAALILFQIYEFYKRKYFSKLTVSLSVLCMILIFPFFVMNPTGMGYRFFMLFVPAAILTSVFIFKNINNKIIYLVCGFLFVLTVTVYATVDLTVFDPPYRLYEKISIKTGKIIRDKKCQLLVAHKPMAEMMDFLLDRDVLPWQPETHYDKKATWRIARDVELWEFNALVDKKFIQKENIHQLSARYILVREDLWYRFTLMVKKENDADRKQRVFSAHNPHVMRPGYLMRFKDKSSR